LISKDNAAPSPQSSSTPASTTTAADLGSGNPHQTPPPTTTADTNVSVAQAEGQETNGGEEDNVIILGEDPYPNVKRAKQCTSQV
jgi:hypothetical protein